MCEYKIVDTRTMGIQDNYVLEKGLERLDQDEGWELVAADRPLLYFKIREARRKA